MSLRARWDVIATTLGLSIEGPMRVSLTDGRVIAAPVLLKNFGAEKGMLLFEDTPADILEIGRGLVDLGYGFSCLGRPSDRAAIDMEIIKEILADWSWSGPADQRPSWLADPPENDSDLLPWVCQR